MDELSLVCIAGYFLNFSLKKNMIMVHLRFQTDWCGNSLYDLIHPDDIEKLREQLSTSESQNTGRILDLKSK